jgi:hypothetical protein
MRSIRVWKSGPDGAGPVPSELPEGVRYVHVFHHVAAQGPPPVEVDRGAPAPPARGAGGWGWVVSGGLGMFLLGLAVAAGVAALYRGAPDPRPGPAAVPAKTSGFADVVLRFYDGGAGPIPGPYGRAAGGTHPERVSERVVLGAPAPGPLAQWNRQADWLALPAGSYVIVGFRDVEVRDGPGPDLVIHSIDRADSAGEQADVFVRSKDGDFKHLGRITQGGAAALDLAQIGFTGTVHAVKIVGLDCLGSSPGFDLVAVEAPGPKPAATATGPAHKH